MTDRIKLRDAIKKERLETYIEKTDLYAKQCDVCGTIFQMEGNGGRVNGGFSHKLDKKKAGFWDEWSNHFEATACSFQCADDLLKGAWKNMKSYEVYKQAGATLEHAKVEISTLITEEELIKSWESDDGTKFRSGIIFNRSGGEIHCPSNREIEMREKMRLMQAQMSELLNTF